MNLIKKVNTRSRNSDISALLTLINKTFGEKDWSNDSFLSPILSEIETLNKQLIEALERLRTYSKMAEKDDLRDQALKALFKLVEGYTYIPINEMRAAAVTVETVLATYGLGIRYEDYATESAKIESLLNDLKKEPVAAVIAQLEGVKTSVTALETAQQAFEYVAIEQAENEQLQKDLTTATQLKKESLTLLNAHLVGYLNTMAKVNPDLYEATAKTLAELINRNNNRVKNRQKNNEEG